MKQNRKRVVFFQFQLQGNDFEIGMHKLYFFKNSNFVSKF